MNFLFVLVPVIILAGWVFIILQAVSPSFTAKVERWGHRRKNISLKANKDILEENEKLDAEIKNLKVEKYAKTISKEFRPQNAQDNNPQVFCKHCGKSIDENSTFCKHCGKPQ